MRMWTPTQLIYHAAMQTPEVTTATGKVVKYEQFPAENVEDEICFLCGGETHGKGQSTKKAIKPTFTDTPYARALHSHAVCVGCAFCLSRRELRNYAIVATETALLHPSREQVRDMLIEPPEPPFLICIAISGQKWVHFKSQVNYSRDVFTVNLEESQISVIPEKLKAMVETVEHLYTTFSKEEILTGRYNQKRIKDFGINRFSQAEDRIAPFRGSQLFELAVFVAQKKEVKKDAPVAEADSGRRGKDSVFAQLRLDWA